MVQVGKSSIGRRTLRKEVGVGYGVGGKSTTNRIADIDVHDKIL